MRKLRTRISRATTKAIAAPIDESIINDLEEEHEQLKQQIFDIHTEAKTEVPHAILDSFEAYEDKIESIRLQNTRRLYDEEARKRHLDEVTAVLQRSLQN